ncbi:probable serine hydrolase [Hyalella azteca]|uniref:Probable serine hydrolase n=1 Tax=Hyalella azteca TaxID=294128 RepID=A0A979FLY6_HYAAZ|nr:probable serine hydrolase [Hyalella azteca]
MVDEEPVEFQVAVPYGHIAGKVWRAGAPCAVLCLHGWQDNAGTFDHLAPLLPRHLCLVAADFPGHGYSSHRPRGVSDSFVEYLVSIDQLVQHFGWSQVVIMGHSMGGAAGMLYAGARPSLVHSLVLLDALKPIHVEPAKLPARTAAALDAVAQIERKLSGPKPSYTHEELLQRAMKSHEMSVGELLQSCSEFILCEVDGSHHVHLVAPERVSPHIASFLAQDKIPHNNIGNGGKSDDDASIVSKILRNNFCHTARL